MGLFGETHYVWDKFAHIDFIKPAFGEVYLDCQLSQDKIDHILAQTANGEKTFVDFDVRIFDANNDTIALAKRTLYLRLKKEFRPQSDTTYS